VDNNSLLFKSIAVTILLLSSLSANELTGFVRTNSLTPMSITVSNETVLTAPKFSEQIISSTIDSLLSLLTTTNYPFAVITPHITKKETVWVNLEIDTGTFVDSISFEIFCVEPIKPWLLSIPVGHKTPFTIDAIVDVQERISALLYVNTISTGKLQTVVNQDTTSVIVPLFIDTKRSFLFDGSIVWSSENGGGVVGYLDASLVNSFWLGESINFNFYGDDNIQRASLNTEFPYLFRLPLTFDFWGDIEVGRDEYGYLETGLSVNYAIQNRWSAGLGGKYYELTEANESRKYGGVLLTLERKRKEFKRGEYQWGMEMIAESGVRTDSSSTLPQGEISSDFQFQWPVSKRFAIGSDLFIAAIASTELGKLHPLEKYRIGGAHSLRGYSENQFSFVGTSLFQNEFRFYYSTTGMLFTFIDAGAGVRTKFTRGDVTTLMGYGAGIRIPTGRVIFSLVWARHINESNGVGRVHVGIGN